MNLSLNEIEVMNELQREYPKQSSIKKLMVVTKRDRSVIKNALVGLKTLNLASTTDKGEVYLLKAGKEHLGLNSTGNSLAKISVSTKTSSLTLASSSPGKEIQNKSDSIEQAFIDLENKLNQKPVSIEDLGLKLNVLKRLSVVLADDIGEVLTSISSDLSSMNTQVEVA